MGACCARDLGSTHTQGSVHARTQTGCFCVKACVCVFVCGGIASVQVWFYVCVFARVQERGGESVCLHVFMCFMCVCVCVLAFVFVQIATVCVCVCLYVFVLGMCLT